jgi:hypothetical protein
MFSLFHLFDPIDRSCSKNLETLRYFTAFYFNVRPAGGFPMPASFRGLLVKSYKFLNWCIRFAHDVVFRMKQFVLILKSRETSKPALH